MGNFLGVEPIHDLLQSVIIMSTKETTPDDNLRRRIGRNLRAAREVAGYRTAQEFSDKHGYKQPTYIQHENGNRSQLKYLNQYARDLNVSVAWLTRDESDEVRHPTPPTPPTPHPEGEILHKELMRNLIIRTLDTLRNGNTSSSLIADVILDVYSKHVDRPEDVLKYGETAGHENVISSEDLVKIVAQGSKTTS